MTEHNPEQQQTANDPFAFLYGYEFIKLTTFRKTGDAVGTPVWFAPDQGRLYVTTGHGAGKLKRLRHTQRVLLAPSDASGKLLEEKSVEARAREVTPDEYEHANATLTRKFGERYVQFTQSPGFQHVGRTFIEIEPVTTEAQP